MCTNYLPVPKGAILESLDWPEPTFDYPSETYATYAAPIRILAPDTGQEEFREACFGLVPFWSKDTKIARHTYNARSETVAEKPSYRTAWKQRRYALVPMLGFFEPDYGPARLSAGRSGAATAGPSQWLRSGRPGATRTAATPSCTAFPC
jgi:putative SOS response-associated peptidase YedK